MADINAEISQALDDLEATVHEDSEPELEKDLSVNDWIGRIRGAAQEAHGMARSGDSELEARAFLQIAAIAVRRAAHIRSVQ